MYHIGDLQFVGDVDMIAHIKYVVRGWGGRADPDTIGICDGQSAAVENDVLVDMEGPFAGGFHDNAPVCVLENDLAVCVTPKPPTWLQNDVAIRA
jgi:hypothetical protein